MTELNGRVAIVTGGGRGIGRGISELLAAQGATVAVNYRSAAEAAAETVAAIEAAGGSAKAYAASVDAADDCAALVAAVVADFGGIDIVCSRHRLRGQQWPTRSGGDDPRRRHARSGRITSAGAAIMRTAAAATS
jgi:NAD(P)-dependent dehydrogenase (short-subunit alcohol dehydrogenase family)